MGFAMKKALHHVAFKPPQNRVLLIRFDAFSNDLKFHRPAERDNRLHDSRVGLGFGQISDK